MSEIIRKEHNVSTREFWTRGYYVGTVGEHGDEKVIQEYVKNQGRNPDNYEKIHEGKQLELFSYHTKA